MKPLDSNEHPDDAPAKTAILIQQCLMAAFQPSQLIIEDQSAQHVTHASYHPEKGHFRITIQSTQLPPSDLIAAHRRIYQALGDLMQTSIHALSIQIL